METDTDVREKTKLEKQILAAVRASNQQLTVEDYAEKFLWIDGFYMAIQFLIWQSMDLQVNEINGVVSARGVPK